MTGAGVWAFVLAPLCVGGTIGPESSKCTEAPALLSPSTPGEKLDSGLGAERRWSALHPTARVRLRPGGTGRSTGASLLLYVWRKVQAVQAGSVDSGFAASDVIANLAVVAVSRGGDPDSLGRRTGLVRRSVGGDVCVRVGEPRQQGDGSHKG